MTVIYHIRPHFPRAKLHELPGLKLCKTQIRGENRRKVLTQVKNVLYNITIAARCIQAGSLFFGMKPGKNAV